MAKTVYERAASAQATDRVTISDLEALIPDLGAERERRKAAVNQATADSLNFALSTQERDEAAASAARAGRDVVALSAAIDALSAKLDAKRASASRKAREDERAAALAERDALAQIIATEWPEIEARIIELLSMVQNSDARMKSLQIYEHSAEAVARGLASGNSVSPRVPVRRLTETKLPSFADPHQLAWPRPQRDWADLGRDDLLRQRRAMQAERARWKRYIVTPPRGNDASIEVLTRSGPINVLRSPVGVVMSEDAVKAAREAGCNVEVAGSKVSIGMPVAATF